MVIIFALVKTNVTNLKFPVLNSVDFFGQSLVNPWNECLYFFSDQNPLAGLQNQIQHP